MRLELPGRRLAVEPLHLRLREDLLEGGEVPERRGGEEETGGLGAVGVADEDGEGVGGGEVAAAGVLTEDGGAQGRTTGVSLDYTVEVERSGVVDGGGAVGSEEGGD